MSFGRGRFCTGLDEDHRNWNEWSGVVKRLGYILIDVKFVHPVFTFVEKYDVFNFMPV
jgi:hypothetical protein